MKKSETETLKHTLEFNDKTKLRFLIWSLDAKSIEWLYKLTLLTYQKYQKKGLL